jgi:WD40 repeat protein
MPPSPLLAQAPDEAWRTITTEHFRVTFPERLETLGRQAADRSERAWELLAEHFIEPPSGKIDVLVTDHTDTSNGFAQVTPSNRITVFARPPVDQMSIGHNDEWLELVITHELAHIVHLDHVTNPIGKAARVVFGRVSLDWPFFPGLGTPRWLVEGLATWYESRLTDAGRIRGSFLEMQLRTAALEGRFEDIGQASGNSPLWPGGNRAYAYGSLFFEYLLDKHGEEKMADLVDAIGGQWVPYRLDAAGRHAFGVGLSDEWRAWTNSLQAEYADLDRALERIGSITEPERLTEGARWGLYPTTSPDGRLLAYTRSDGRSDAQLKVRDLVTDEVRSLGRTNGLATFGWTPDGRLLVSQLELDDPYRAYGDLYFFGLDGSERRLTHGQRVGQPSVSPDGAQAVAVRQGDGTNALVTVDLEGGNLTTLVDAEPSVHWAFPRWSPDGRWIAATRWVPGAYHDVVVLDAQTGNLVHRVTEDRAMDLAPSWSPDGRWLLWSSDRSGIFNVLGARVDAETGRTSEVVLLTNVRTGAAYPSVDAEGETLYFSGYHVDGWEIERIPFRPATQPAAGPAIGRFTPTPARTERGERPETVEPYSAFPTLWPTYWEVSYGDPIAVPEVRGEDTFLRRRELLGFGLGIQTGGYDLVGRHSWGAFGRVTTSGGKFEGGASYAFVGLGNPILSVTADQTYDDAGQFVVEPDLDTLIVLERERSVSGAVTVLAPNWRRALSVTLGGGMTWRNRQLLDETLQPAQDFSLNRETIRLANYRASINVNSTRSHAFQMGMARGASVFLFGGIEQELAVPDSLSGAEGLDRSLAETQGQLRGAIPLWGGGYARHVLALRLSGGAATGPGAGPLHYRVGGASGQREPLTGLELFGGNFIFFPVRGYETSSRFGRYAWSASAEYRFPLWLVNRGLGAWPLHLDRAVGSLFFDAGNAWGPDVWPTGFQNPLRTALASAGAEVTMEILGLYDIVVRLRGGVGFPFIEGDGPRVWLRAGLPF